MNKLGEIIKAYRMEKKLPLRKVAPYLDIDQAILSKIENGERKATKEQIVKLARFFKVNEKELMLAWLSDKVLYILGDESLALEAMQVAEKELKYSNKKKK
ncbi:MAG: helix-turn-helix transcriptional regulator [Cytophagaceae bacterium]|nr:helix-turn-helix transcriptional regulator [Cytophagaceae bacterium]